MAKAYHRSSPITDTVLAMVRRTTGVATDEVQGLSQRQVGRAVERLVKAGQAFPARVTRMQVRYFATPELADAYVEERRRAAAQAVIEQSRRAFKAPADGGPAPWSRNAEPYFPTDADGKPKWKFTRCPPSQMGLHRTNTHSDLH